MASLALVVQPLIWHAHVESLHSSLLLLCLVSPVLVVLPTSKVSQNGVSVLDILINLPARGHHGLGGNLCWRRSDCHDLNP